ncbi:hypothetical protein ACIBSV_46780 [Embleya sp. NPDC050154]|uniref:hypothetical protein n=1 Tax=Embleya sp. NPDC050154 TaxID=3363988 RepID=UPI00379ECB05
MTVKRLPGGRLRVPWTETVEDGDTTYSVDGDRDIGPDDEDYAFWAAVLAGDDPPTTREAPS